MRVQIDGSGIVTAASESLTAPYVQFPINLSPKQIIGLLVTGSAPNRVLRSGNQVLAREDDESVFSQSFLSRSTGVYDVKAYGAKGDNATDDGAAINAAITAAGANGLVEFPPGTYYSTERHVPVSGQTWYGAGIGRTTIRGSRAFDYTIFSSSLSSPLTRFTLRDITIDAGNVANASCVGLSYVNYCTFERVRMVNVPSGWMLRIGVDNGATDTFMNYGNTFIDCEFDNHASSLEMLLIFNSKSTRVVRPRFTNNVGGGPVVGLYQKTQDTVFVDPHWKDIAGTCLYYSFTCDNTDIQGAYFENTGSGILGANTSDHDSFGATTVGGLRITNLKYIGGGNSTSATAVELGSVVNATIDNPYIEGCQIGIVVRSRAAANVPSSNWSILAPVIRNCNPENNFHALHPAIYISDGSEWGLISGGKIYDDQATKTQRYPVTISGAFGGGAYTYQHLTIRDSRLSADAANSGTSVVLVNAAAIGAGGLITGNADYSGTNPAQTA